MWTARLTFTMPGLSDDRRLDIVGDLAANAVYDSATGQLTLTFEVPGATLRQAADAALRTAGAAVGVRPTRILVMPTEEFIAETENPPALDLLGVAEIAEMLHVSRQRANQLIARKDFPEPVSRLAAGPAFTRSSVEAWHKRWAPTRRPQGGRPRREDTATAPSGSGAPAARRGAAPAQSKRRFSFD